MSFAVAWGKGGHVERLGTTVLLCDYLLTGMIARRPTTEHFMISTVVESVTTLVFVWMAFRFDRWWLLATAAALVLIELLAILYFVRPGVSHYAVISAQLGLWILVQTVLLAGVAERWLAGEPAISHRETWRRRSPSGA